MDIQGIKEKIIKGEMSDDELSKLLSSKTKKQSGGFMSTLLKGFVDNYTTPQIWRVVLNAILLLTVILAIVFLSYTEKIDAMVTTILLSFVLGYLFGKIK